MVIRINTIDIAKGLGILLVVIGHSMQTGSYPVRVYGLLQKCLKLGGIPKLSTNCIKDNSHVFKI